MVRRLFALSVVASLAAPLACGHDEPPPAAPATPSPTVVAVGSASPAAAPTASPDAGEEESPPLGADVVDLVPLEEDGGAEEYGLIGLIGVRDGGNPFGGGAGLGGLGSWDAGRGPIGLGALGKPASGSGSGIGLGHGRLGSSPRVSPQLRQGAVRVTGRLPPEVIQRIVRQNFGRFRLCYENGLRNNPKLEGKVVVSFTIDRAGATTDTKDGGSDLSDKGVTSCVVRAFSNLSFPQPEGGIVRVVYPIHFSPGAPAAPAPAAPPAKPQKKS